MPTITFTSVADPQENTSFVARDLPHGRSQRSPAILQRIEFRGGHALAGDERVLINTGGGPEESPPYQHCV